MIDETVEQETTEVKRDRLWPILLTLGLGTVIAVNALFIYIAVTGADDVDPAYVQGDR